MGRWRGEEVQPQSKLEQSSGESPEFLNPGLPSPAFCSSFKRMSVLVKSSRDKGNQAESSLPSVSTSHGATRGKQNMN